MELRLRKVEEEELYRKRSNKSFQIRTRLLQFCTSIPIDASRLKESGIGKAVMYLSRCGVKSQMLFKQGRVFLSILSNEVAALLNNFRKFSLLSH